MNFITPNHPDIASALWLDSVDPDSEEAVRTLHIIYKNGDIATIEHKYCSLYNFLITYQPHTTNAPTTLSQIFAIVDRHLPLAARTDDLAAGAVEEIKEALISQKSSVEKSFGWGSDATSEKNNWMTFGIHYLPIDSFSRIDGIITFDMTLNQSGH